MKNSIIIGIAGGSASGKTSISRQVYEFFKGSHTTCIIKQDDYYKVSDRIVKHGPVLEGVLFQLLV